MTSARNRRRAQAMRAGLVGAGAVMAVTAAAAPGCLQILGDEGPFVLATGGSAGTGGSGATGGSAGAGGTGGAMSTCEPGISEACYGGPDGTLDQGVCKGGMHTCAQDGTWGECTGQVLPGVETCASKDDEDCDKNECARWSLISGGDGGMIGTALTTDPQGNVLFSGLFGDKVTIGDIPLDTTANGPLFLAKLDAAGKPQWAKTFGGFDFEKAVQRSLATDDAGNILMSGVFEGTLQAPGFSLTSEAQDFFAAKFTPGGALAWLQKYGGSMDQEPWNMVLTTSGDLLITGTYDAGFSIGQTSTSGAGAFVARMSSSDGAVLSAKSFNTLTGQDVSPVVAAGPDGTWALAGRCSDGAVINGQTLASCSHFIAKFGPEDAPIWVVSIPPQPTTLSVKSDGSVVVGGDFLDGVDFGDGPLLNKGSYDVFVASLAAADGAVQWVESFGGTEDNSYPKIVLDSQDRIYVAIDTDDMIDFGGGPLSSSGLNDTFVVALDAGGHHRWSRVFGDATLQSASLLAVRGGDAGLMISVNTPGEINFGAGTLQTTSMIGLAIAELGP